MTYKLTWQADGQLYKTADTIQEAAEIMLAYDRRSFRVVEKIDHDTGWPYFVPEVLPMQGDWITYTRYENGSEGGVYEMIVESDAFDLSCDPVAP